MLERGSSNEQIKLFPLSITTTTTTSTTTTSTTSISTTAITTYSTS